MALDSISETIAHFVGTFELTIEQSRLRDQYEEFTALRRKAEVEGLDDPASIHIKADLDIPAGEYKALPYSFQPSEPEMPLPAAPLGPVSEAVIVLDGPGEPVRYVPENEISDTGPSSFVQLIILQPETVPLGSAVTVTVQTVYMRDNDVVGDGDFRDPEALMVQGEQMLDMALSLHAIAAPSFSLADYQSTEMLAALADQMANPMISDIEGVTVHQFHGDDAMGVIVNGEYVTDAPEWKDLLPEYHQPDDTENTAELPYPEEWDQSKDPEFDDGHLVVTGGNVAINAMAATVAWVDAPIIAVGGQAVSLTAISQVAVVSDWDQGEPGTGSGTNIVQTSQIEVESKTAPWLGASSGAASAAPIVIVDHVQGDLVVANFIKQDIDATDIDQIETEISASSTMYALGDNEMYNVSDLIQLGNYYDVIIIDGNMISVDVVNQTLVLVDDDVISGGMDPAMDEDEAGGDENLVMNEASVKTVGDDTYQDMSQEMSDTMALADDDIAALEDALMNNPDFAGMEQIRVLKIDGDLVQVNVVEQTTVVQDQDDIELSGPDASQTEVVAGSNALLNSASVTKMGVDSTIMAANGAYSDLLLHQASLLDMPTNEDITAMTNEAIAAIMSDMSVAQPDAALALTAPTTDTTTNDDGLQTVLA
ncbi:MULTISPECIES: type I secretion protein [unclassified Ruegeria]|uniref:type I secretion protein n=1 Tax=unclassified Ruegeria TaxID=2625375 RepID=UPI001490E722|nr:MULTISPECIES: type I secretion protein [unclassified Ruegeria]NOD36014.1 type I secretion protein [Ruegeria sp. HKCCD7296]NOE43406.1 type I secretion protein [Ruegeria sp. HKCCD7319]